MVRNKIGRPKLGRVALKTTLAPETRVLLQKQALKRSLSIGGMIDFLAEYWQKQQ